MHLLQGAHAGALTQSSNSTAARFFACQAAAFRALQPARDPALMAIFDLKPRHHMLTPRATPPTVTCQLKHKFKLSTKCGPRRTQSTCGPPQSAALWRASPPRNASFVEDWPRCRCLAGILMFVPQQTASAQYKRPAVLRMLMLMQSFASGAPAATGGTRSGLLSVCRSHSRGKV